MASSQNLLFILLIVCLAHCATLANKAHAVKTNAIDKSGEERTKDAQLQPKDPWQLIEKLKSQVAEKESELENAVAINRGFEHMIQLISIMGQVDTFLTDRTQTLLKELSTLADGAEKTKKS